MLGNRRHLENEGQVTKCENKLNLNIWHRRSRRRLTDKTRLLQALMGWPTPETVPKIHRNSGGGHKFVPEYNRRTAMISNASEAAIDQIVANCNGDIRGALKALLLVNERLEAELAEFYAAVGLDGMARGSNAVH